MMDKDKALRLLAQGVQARRKWRKEAKDDFAFVAGHQWAQEDIKAMDDALRPHTTFNNIAPIVDAISGHEVSNRQAVTYIPRQVGAAGVNEVLTAAADYVREEGDIDAEESDAFYDCTVCGEGWTDTEIDYDRNLDGQICTDRVDPDEMDVDPLATKKNHADAKWVCRSKVYTKEQAKERWPDGEFEPYDDRGSDDEPVNVIAAAFYASDSGEGGRPGKDGDNIVVHDFQYWEHETVYRIPQRFLTPALVHILLKGYSLEQAKKPPNDAVPYVKPYDLTPDANGLITVQENVWNRLTKESGLPKELFETAVETKAVLKQKKRCYYRIYLSKDEELETCKTPTGDSFTYKAMTAKRDRKENSWYGVVRAMKDPQKWSNKFMSSMLETLAYGAKGGLLYEAGAFLDEKTAEQDWANPAKNIPMEQGAISGQKVMPRPTNNMPPQMYQLMTYADSNIKAVAGVNPEVMGLAQTLDPSGVMEEGRRQSGLNMLAYLFDALRRYRKEQGRLLLCMIKKYIPEGRLVKIVGPEGAQYVPLAYDKGTTDYDVEVDEAPTSPNVKQKTWDTGMQIIEQLPQVAGMILPSLIKYSPLPAALVSDLQKAQQKAAQQPPPPPPPEVQAKMAKDQSQAALNNAKAQQLGQEGQIKAMLAQIDAQSENAKANAEVLKAHYDFLAIVAKYHQAVQDNQTQQATAYFNHLQALYKTIEGANKATQSQHGTLQAAHGTLQAAHGTLQSAHQTVQTLNQPETA